jgi:GAF domain-containing protein
MAGRVQGPGPHRVPVVTQSEIVVPVLTPDDALLAVLDVDSDTLGAFDPTDREHLEALCRDLGAQFGDTELR